MEKTDHSSYWTEEQVLNIAKQYKSRSEFAQKCRGGYDRARKLGILDKCTWGEKRKPNNYWTKEHILEVAKQYKTKKDFQKYSKYAYNKALSLNILVECTWFIPTKEIMTEKLTKWDEDTILEVAKKYNSRKEFQIGHSGAYNRARKLGILDKCTWFVPTKEILCEKLTKWDEDTILEVAKKYNSRKEFAKGCGSAYSKALELGILDKCTWFKTRKEILCEKLTKWDEDTILEVAKKYVYLCDFKNEYGGAYSKALELGILDKCTWLKRKSNPYEDKSDVIYVYELPEYNSAYVGRTIDIVRRHKQHQTTQNDSVYKFCQTHNILLPDMKILECDLTPDEGSKKEKEYIKKYEEKGWKLINIATGGSLGALGSTKWSKEKILDIAKQYKTRSEFAQKCSGAYNRAKKLGILDKCTWFEEIIKPSGYWVEEKILDIAKQYKTRSEFAQKCSGAYNRAKKLGILDKCTWFEEIIKPSGYWVEEKILEVVKQYKTRSEFAQKCTGAYDRARKLGILDKCTWFEGNKKWTYETCYQEAKKYNSRWEFGKKNSRAYQLARENGWLDNWFSVSKTGKKWTYETCYQEAKKYNSRKEFEKSNGSAYKVALKNDWLDDFFPKTKNI